MTNLNPIYNLITSTLLEALDGSYPEHGQSFENIIKMLSPAPNLKMGHIAFGCFPLAKNLKKSPAQISQEICEKIKKNDVIEEAQSTGPYINFFISLNALGNRVLAPINSGEFLHLPPQKSERWMVEYSQPNTHKELHVGHMRNLCLGNALVKMAKYVGKDILSVTYPGDVGTHVAKCLWYLKNHCKEQAPTENPGAWLGSIYTKANNLLQDQRGTEFEESNRQELTQILKELHAKSGPFYEQWKTTRQWSIELMQEAYDWADVSFDRWFWESEMDAPSVEYILDLYKQGKLVKDQGAIGMDLSEDKLGFCLLLKSDGTGLYSTKDVELAKIKFEEYGVDRSIYIVDDRQARHFQQVFKVLEKLGFEQSQKCFHLKYAMVELKDGAMSSRKGNIVPLMDLVSMMEEKIKKDYLNKYLESDDWDQEEVNATAQMIANGAIKYGMIRVDNNRKIVFDMNEWLKLDGETGPYLQYVHARIHSLCKKLDYSQSSDLNWDLLESDQEKALALKLLHFNDVMVNSVEKLQTIHVCSYLYELGKLFNSFYAECPIQKAQSEELKKARLSLAHATGLVMKTGLNSLGIPTPLRM